MYYEMKYRLEVNIEFHSIYWHCCCYQNKEVSTTGRVSRRGKNCAPPSPAIKDRGDVMQRRLTSRRGERGKYGIRVGCTVGVLSISELR